MAENNQTSPLFTWQHYLVMAIGGLVLVLLFFADKTTLKGDREELVVTEESADQAPTPRTNPGSSGSLPEGIKALPQDNVLDSLMAGLDLKSGSGLDEKGEQDLRLLVERLNQMGRMDAAAWYAAILAERKPSNKNRIVAGALLRNACNQPPVVEDTVLFRKYSDKALDLLSKAAAEAPDDEDALIEYGLALVESRKPMNSMQGIQQLVKVLELNPDNPEASFHLGVFSRQTGQYEKAVSRFEKVLSVDPDNQLASFYLASSYLESGDAEKAKPLLRSLQEQKNDPAIAQAARELLNTIN